MRSATGIRTCVDGVADAIIFVIKLCKKIVVKLKKLIGMYKTARPQGKDRKNV